MKTADKSTTSIVPFAIYIVLGFLWLECSKLLSWLSLPFDIKSIVSIVLMLSIPFLQKKICEKIGVNNNTLMDSKEAGSNSNLSPQTPIVEQDKRSIAGEIYTLPNYSNVVGNIYHASQHDTKRD